MSVLPNLSLVMAFLWNVFSNFIFENFSRMKRRWREKSQLPVAIKRSFLSSHKWKKLFEPCRELRLLSKQIICQSYITFQIISTQGYLRALDIPVFTKWIWFANSFKCFYDGNVWPPGQRAETCERIVSESLRKICTKFYGLAGHVDRVKTAVTNHLREMFRSHIHKVAQRNTAARINWDKLTEINS